MNEVVVVTVTYNSSAFLRRLVEAVAAQTSKVSGIIVVDNNSTKEHVTENNKLAKEYDFVRIIHSKKNLGGAGGFQMGVQYVIDKQIPCDWVWLMDDDAFPTDACLENLLKYDDLEDIGCLTPVIYGVERQHYQLYHHKYICKYLNQSLKVAESYDDLADVTSIDANAFVGPLIRRNIFDEIGIPDGSLFIEGDDTEFTFRISRKHKIYLIKDAIINHRDIISADDKINPKGIWKEYYLYRNRMLFVKKYKHNFFSGIYGYMLIFRALIRDIRYTQREDMFEGYRKERNKCFVRGFFDGLIGKKGKVIDPVEYNKRFDNH